MRLEWSELLNIHRSERMDKYHYLHENPFISIVQISTWRKHHLTKVFGMFFIIPMATVTSCVSDTVSLITIHVMTLDVDFINLRLTQSGFLYYDC